MSLTRAAIFRIAIGLAMVASTACSDSPEDSVGSAAAPVSPSAVASAIQGAIEAPDSPSAPRPDWERAILTALYAPNHYRALWTDTSGHPIPDTREAFALLNRALDEGLDPVDYRADWLQQYASRLETDASLPAEVGGFDAAMSRSIVRYYRHLHRGRIDPRALHYTVSAAPDDEVIAGAVRSAITDRRITERAIDLAPGLAEYGELRATLVRYRALAGGARLAPPTVTTSVRPGQPMSGLDNLYRLLVALGDLPRGTLAPESLLRFEGPLVDGVKRFQARHGLTANGVFGPETQAAFAVPFPQRVRQIELALERLRWISFDASDRLVVVNGPASRLWTHDTPAGRPVISMATTSVYTPGSTPPLVEDVHEIVFRPSVDDERVCERGALAAYLFVSGNGRAHGCPQVEDAVALAAWALSGQSGWTEARIRAAVAGDGPPRVALARPLRVLLSDNTAIMPGDGMIHFAEDIHARDADLHQALAGRPRIE